MSERRMCDRRTETSSRSEHKSLGVLLVFTFFMVLGFEMIMPLLIGRYVYDLSFPAVEVGFALAVRKFFQQGLAMLGGVMADCFDVRFLICFGVLIRSFSFLLLAFSETTTALLVAMIFTGLGGILFETPYQVAIAGLTTEENRPGYYSLNNTIVGVASTAGPLVGAVLLRFDFSLVCLGAAVCFAVNFFLAGFFLPGMKRRKKKIGVGASFQTLFHDGRYIRFVVVMTVFWLCASQIDISFPLRLRELSGRPESVGWMYAIYAAITGLFQYPLTSLLLRRRTSRQLVTAGCLIVSCSVLSASFIGSTAIFLWMTAIFTLGMILARPNQQSMAATLAPPGARGLYLGFHYLAFALGSGGGALIGGSLFDLTANSVYRAAPWCLYCFIGLLASFGFSISKDFDRSDWTKGDAAFSRAGRK